MGVSPCRIWGGSGAAIGKKVTGVLLTKPEAVRSILRLVLIGARQIRKHVLDVFDCESKQQL